jgi:hypothetical protein
VVDKNFAEKKNFALSDVSISRMYVFGSGSKVGLRQESWQSGAMMMAAVVEVWLRARIGTGRAVGT